MKALRMILFQNSANYKKEETVDNKMTYPLPPLSTIIGAIHTACGYTEYKNMDISVQGKFESMHKKMYKDYCFHNRFEPDRDLLVKLKNPNILSNAFDKVAVITEKSKNLNFRAGNCSHVYNQRLFEEYLNLYELKNITNNFQEEKYKFYAEEYSKYRTVVSSVKYYEILDQVTLIIHIRTDESTLHDILDNIYNLKSIGRSEDMVQVINAEIVELQDEIADEVESPYSAYLDYNLLKEDKIYPKLRNSKVSGTRYYLNKDYHIENNKRIFNKKKVLYTSQYVIDECSENLLIDEYDGQKLIVNFL